MCIWAGQRLSYWSTRFSTSYQLAGRTPPSGRTDSAPLGVTDPRSRAKYPVGTYHKGHSPMSTPSFGIVAAAIAAIGVAAFSGTALAAPVNVVQASCVSYTIVGGKLVQTTSSGCTSSSTGTKGSLSSSSSSSSNGKSTPGVTVNNCVPASSCKTSATGIGGKGH